MFPSIKSFRFLSADICFIIVLKSPLSIGPDKADSELFFLIFDNVDFIIGSAIFRKI